MNEKFSRFMGKENVRAGIQIALTIGFIGSMIGLLAHDQKVHGDYYVEQRQIREELCRVDPSECEPSLYFSPFHW